MVSAESPRPPSNGFFVLTIGRCPKKLAPFLDGRGVSSAFLDGLLTLSHRQKQHRRTCPKAFQLIIRAASKRPNQTRFFARQSRHDLLTLHLWRRPAIRQRSCLELQCFSHQFAVEGSQSRPAQPVHWHVVPKPQGVRCRYTARRFYSPATAEVELIAFLE